MPDFDVILANQPGDASWPMHGCDIHPDSQAAAGRRRSAEALKFFAWAYAKGGKMAEALDYVPMPERSSV